MSSGLPRASHNELDFESATDEDFHEVVVDWDARVVHDAPPVDSGAFRQAMRTFATGVAVITTHGPAGAEGMTANSVTSVSLRPPLLLACLKRNSRTTAAICASGTFAVNILGEGQDDIGYRFASAGGDHFAGGMYPPDEFGNPTIAGAIALLSCAVRRVLSAGDHVIVLGEVASAEGRDGAPLVFHDGRFTTLR